MQITPIASRNKKCVAQINGERNPSEVYVSFRDAVLRILGMSSGEIQIQDIPQSLEAEVRLKFSSY